MKPADKDQIAGLKKELDSLNKLYQDAIKHISILESQQKKSADVIHTAASEPHTAFDAILGRINENNSFQAEKIAQLAEKISSMGIPVKEPELNKDSIEQTLVGRLFSQIRIMERNSAMLHDLYTALSELY